MNSKRAEFEQLVCQVHDRLRVVLRDVRGIDEDLCGACLIGACVLYERLYRRGYNPMLVRGVDPGGEHYWVLAEGWLLDPTYSQYDKDQDWLVLPSVEHPESFEQIFVDVGVPTDWDAFEHPETYWRRFWLGSWRKSQVCRQR